MRDVNLASQDLSGTAFRHCPITHIFSLTNESVKQELLQVISEITFSVYLQKLARTRFWFCANSPAN